MRKRKRHGSYKFTEKTHSKRGIVATILALVLLVLYLVILELAFRANGGLSAYYGSIGVLAMLASVVVVVVAAGSLREEDSFRLFPRLGCHGICNMIKGSKGIIDACNSMYTLVRFLKV